MKILVLINVLGIAAASTANAARFRCENIFESTNENPVLAIRQNPNSLVPHGIIQNSDLENSIREGIEIAKAEINTITTNSKRPTYENTIEAITVATESLDIAEKVLGNYLSLIATKDLEAIGEKWLPEASKFQNTIYFNTELFRRVQIIYDRRMSLRLSKEKMSILESTYRAFVANGANLKADAKARVSAIDERLASLEQLFSKNQRGAMDAVILSVDNQSRLKGLPEDEIARAKKLAEEKGRPAEWAFSMSPATAIKVWTYADDAKLREECWRMYSTQTSGGPFDNRGIAIETAQLRLERAKILGYKSYAQFATENRMAKTPEAVEDFIQKLRVQYLPAAKKDAEDLAAFAKAQGKIGELMPWDIKYYAEKLRKERYSVDDQTVRPFFPLEAVHDGALRIAEKLYEIRFTKLSDAPKWDPAVRVYEVRDRRNDRLLGYFYFDPYVRTGKDSGAWHSTMLTAGEWNAQARRPHMLNALNLSPPTEAQPTLLTIDEVRTVFHELGHGLHTLFTLTRFRDKSGTNVARDFVELPSQLFEEWGVNAESLRSFARHFETGEVISADLIEKLRRADNYRVATVGLSQLNLIALDMAWHSTDVEKIRHPEDIQTFETEIGAPYRVYEGPRMLTSASFSHIFAGGYAAGYYSYKWADTLVADAFEYFTLRGIFNRKLAQKYRRDILSKGGTVDPGILYQKFRGQAPDPTALIRREQVGGP